MPKRSSLQEVHVRSLAEILPQISTEWIVFRFPREKSSKPALYSRMWRIRELGIDAMVREINGSLALLARKEHDRNESPLHQVQVHELQE